METESGFKDGMDTGMPLVDFNMLHEIPFCEVQIFPLEVETSPM